jgi:hypothetical protein
LPPEPDKTYVLRQLRDRAMWANVAITRQPDGTPGHSDRRGRRRRETGADGVDVGRRKMRGPAPLSRAVSTAPGLIVG